MSNKLVLKRKGKRLKYLLDHPEVVMERAKKKLGLLMKSEVNRVQEHWLDYTNQADLKKADPCCGKCHGTGVAGKVFAQGKAVFKNGVNLVCRCVPRPIASVEAEEAPSQT